MNTPHFTAWTLSLQPLSPIHVGSGESVEPFTYTITERHGDYFLHVYNLPRLVASLSPADRRALNDLLNAGRPDFPSIRQWLHDKCAASKAYRFTVQIQQSAAKELIQHLDNPDRLGQIDLMQRAPDTGRPFIPGSSIKGAIRTAIIDRLLRHAKPQRPKDERKSVAFEAQVLGHLDHGRPDLYRDPFRQLACSDIPLTEDACMIDRIRIIRKGAARPARARPRADSAEKIAIYRDITWSLLDDVDDAYQGQVRIYHALAPKLPRPISIKDIISACNDYYIPRLENELRTFLAHPPQGQSDDPDRKHVRSTLLKAAESLDDRSCIIRLGRHSHFECVTFSDAYRKPPKRGAGATRSYAAGTYPLGWARLSFAPN